MSGAAKAATSNRPSRAHLDARLVRAASSRAAGRIAYVTEPAPRVAPEVLLDLASSMRAITFLPPEGTSYVGLGACAIVTAQGASRFETLRAESDALFARIDVTEAEATRPRLFGGLAFDAGRPLGGYAELSDAHFVLPRITYAVSDGAAQLSICLDDAESLETTRARAADVFAHLERAEARAGKTSGVVEVRTGDEAAFEACVERALEAIEANAVRKVVLARTAEVALDGEVDVRAVCERLAARYPSCTRFTFGFGASTFLGATPERLVLHEGDTVLSEALAGSCPRGEERSLLASLKNREEHAFVVEAILSALEPHCEEVRAGDRPELRLLHDVVHLRTPIVGRSNSAHVLELVEALHPTPAVGGVPRAAALEFIRDNEPMPRGYYASPFGYFDSAGEGSFVVALRSGLVTGAKVVLHAGAGIVRGSSPRSEWEETALKMGALLGALEGEAG